MKSIFLVLLVLLVSCQREIRNEVGVGYNKELIIPPTNDLPLPNSADENTRNTEISNNPVIESILNQTNANEANPNIIEQIDNGNEIIIEENDTEEEEGNFIDRIFRGFVIDFIDIYIGKYHWPAFNIADSCITVGFVIFMMNILFLNKKL